MKTRITGLALAASLIGFPFAAPAAGPARESAPPALFQQLLGQWKMVGDVRGKPVEYKLASQLALDGQFLELHMKDASDPPRYEARVFIGRDIGHDGKPNRIVAHWLDSFGAAYSTPHGTGSIDGNVLRFEIPYKSGPFRDTITFKPSDGTWTLDIEAGDGKGGWKHFAAYTVSRTPDSAPRRP